MFLIGAVIVFLAFFLNVALGAFADAAFLGDVGEMSSVLFVVAILRKEADRSNNDDSR